MEETDAGTRVTTRCHEHVQCRVKTVSKGQRTETVGLGIWRT